MNDFVQGYIRQYGLFSLLYQIIFNELQQVTLCLQISRGQLQPQETLWDFRSNKNLQKADCLRSESFLLALGVSSAKRSPWHTRVCSICVLPFESMTELKDSFTMKKEGKRFEREIFSGLLRRIGSAQMEKGKRLFAGVWKVMVGQKRRTQSYFETGLLTPRSFKCL